MGTCVCLLYLPGRRHYRRHTSHERSGSEARLAAPSAGQVRNEVCGLSFVAARGRWSNCVVDRRAKDGRTGINTA